MENPLGILDTGFGCILGALAEMGYDAEWPSIPASAFGAPQKRERIFLVAHPRSNGIAGSCPESLFWKSEEQTQQNGRGFEEARKRQAIPESGLCDFGDGLSNYVDQLRCLGNAIVPQVAQFVGECIMTHNGGEFTFAELFAGIGGFRLGFEWASGRVDDVLEKAREE
jgi:DNA (cytosine-5)-methyltransferase 1